MSDNRTHADLCEEYSAMITALVNLDARGQDIAVARAVVQGMCFSLFARHTDDNLDNSEFTADVLLAVEWKRKA